MGVCLSLDAEEKKARAISDDIDKKLQSSSPPKNNKEVKILLLGAGESGKSTLVKQMKIIHNDGFSHHELMAFKPAVLDNLLSSMKYVLSGMGLLRINLDDPKNRIHAQTVLACQRCYDEDHIMYGFLGNALRSLWNDAGVRRAVARGYEYELNDSAIYYFENMDRLCVEKFRPNTTDVLRARIRTQGVIETCFQVNNMIFRMFDVGGQRSERRKWIHCFEDVVTILFVSALSGYDMTLCEDASVNRLEESLRLFRQICNNPFFRKTAIMLFLNKMDLFHDKIAYSERHLRYYFHQYKGADGDVTTAARFINALFMQHALGTTGNPNNPSPHPPRYPHRPFFSHYTTATDTSNIEVVFRAITDTVVRVNLQAAQLL